MSDGCYYEYEIDGCPLHLPNPCPDMLRGSLHVPKTMPHSITYRVILKGKLYRTYSERSRIWSWTSVRNHPNLVDFPSYEAAYDHSRDIPDAIPFRRITNIQKVTPSQSFEQLEKRHLA